MTTPDADLQVLNDLLHTLEETSGEISQLESDLTRVIGLLDEGALTGQPANRMRAALSDRVLPFTGQMHTHVDRLAHDLNGVVQVMLKGD